MTSIQTTQALQANQKYCHGCATPIHTAAPTCPFCGAPQHQTSPLAAYGAPAVARSGTTAGHRTTSDQKFCAKCGCVMHESAAACPQCGAQQASPRGQPKSRSTAIALALFLGGIGGHHFYLGNNIRGLLYLCFCFTFIPAGIALLEALVYLSTSDAVFATKYANN